MNLTIIDTETSLTFELAEGVNTEKIDPLAYYLVMLCGKVISDTTGKTPVLTSGWRDVARQKAAMAGLKKKDPALYEKVYGPMMKRGQDPATMPHADTPGRAADWLFAGFEKAEGKLLEINGWLMEGAKEMLGYTPSPFILPEKGKDKDGKPFNLCYHIQLCRQIPNRQKLRDYFASTFART
jgi:hypothetical protein